MRFEKVSYKEFKKALFDSNVVEDNVTEDDIKEMYEGIKLPKRGTRASAGYDFFMPFGCFINSGRSVTIPTGIRWIPDDESYTMMLFPRSGLGTKYRLQLNNTVGIIDADYFMARNEGHIIAKLTNDSKNPEKLLYLKEGQGFMHGIITRYYKVDDDDTKDVRTGGFGSTDIFDRKFPKELSGVKDKEENMISEREWKDFRNAGMLWLVNMILHVFGWCIALYPSSNGKFTAKPCRTKFRGFPDDLNKEGYIRVSEFMKENAEELLDESNE